MENKQFYRIGKKPTSGATEVSEINFYNGVHYITSIESINNCQGMLLRVYENAPEKYLNDLLEGTSETDKGVYYAFLSTYNERLLKFSKLSQQTFDSLT